MWWPKAYSQSRSSKFHFKSSIRNLTNWRKSLLPVTNKSVSLSSVFRFSPLIGQSSRGLGWLQSETDLWPRSAAISDRSRVGISMISTQWSHIVQSCVRTNTPRAEAPSPRSLARRETWTQIAQWGSDIVKHRSGIRLWPGTKELITLKDIYFSFIQQISSAQLKQMRTFLQSTNMLVNSLFVRIKNERWDQL